MHYLATKTVRQSFPTLQDSLSCRSMTENNQEHKTVRWNRRALPMRECSLDAKGKRAILKAYHLFPSLADLNICAQN